MATLIYAMSTHRLKHNKKKMYTAFLVKNPVTISYGHYTFINELGHQVVYQNTPKKYTKKFWITPEDFIESSKHSNYQGLVISEELTIFLKENYPEYYL